MRFAASVVPDELPAAVVRARVLVIPDPVALLCTQTQQASVWPSRHGQSYTDRRTTGADGEYMVEELAVLGGPSDLHHPRRDNGHLVVPNPRVHAERASHALERRGVTSSLRRGSVSDSERGCYSSRHVRAPAHLQAGGGDLQVLADVVAVEHGVDVGQVDFLVGELSTLL